MIQAPYNFVPLSRDICYPSWGEEVTQDIPFSDGESGEISLKIIAESSLYIRNHFEEGDESYSRGIEIISKEFCHKKISNEKKYYIPASSLKGMLRNITEIMTFSKITIDEKEHAKIMGVRDMSDNNLTGKATGKVTKKNFGYGILYRENDNSYRFEDYGNKIRLILQNDLSSIKYTTAIGSQSKVEDKYNAIEPFTKIKVSPDPYNNPGGNNFFDKFVVIPDNNGEEGELFFNGHFPYGRTSKHYEFIFLKSDIVNSCYPLTDELIRGFKTVYFDDPESNVGQFWKGKNKIPVFYKVENGQITDLGLTQVYKKAYKNSILHAAEQTIEEKKCDFSELLFGIQTEDISLKGRIQVGHFSGTHVEGGDIVKKEVLNTPKPSYYPNYIRQTKLNGNKVKSYMTLMSKKAQISGWKAYPLQDTIQTYPLPKKNGKDVLTMVTQFKPLDKGSVFEGKIRFHNLKQTEIGALLSALTFHGQHETHKHNIGMAKPLGYGQISIDITDIYTIANNKEKKETLTLDNVSKYLKAFEIEMQNVDNWLNDKAPFTTWKESKQLKELYAMHNKAYAQTLKYQMLSNPSPHYDNNKNDFVGAKADKDYLAAYSSKFEEKIQSPSSQTSPVSSSTQSRQPLARRKISRLVKLQDIANELNIDINELLKIAKENNIEYVEMTQIIKSEKADELKNLVKK